LLSPAGKTVPVSGLQSLDLHLDNASLHLTEQAFAFFQAQADFLRSNSARPLHLCHQLALERASS